MHSAASEFYDSPELRCLFWEDFCTLSSKSRWKSLRVISFTTAVTSRSSSLNLMMSLSYRCFRWELKMSNGQWNKKLVKLTLMLLILRAINKWIPWKHQIIIQFIVFYYQLVLIINLGNSLLLDFVLFFSDYWFQNSIHYIFTFPIYLNWRT